MSYIVTGCGRMFNFRLWAPVYKERYNMVYMPHMRVRVDIQTHTSHTHHTQRRNNYKLLLMLNEIQLNPPSYN